MGVVKVKRLEIKNRSAKAINSVQLRWKIFYFDDPSKALLERIGAPDKTVVDGRGL